MRAMKRSKIARIGTLPVELISLIVSLTTPRDACRCSAVSHFFQQAADSDDVWKSFLPSDYEDIISRSASPNLLRAGLSKKNLFFSLCKNPIFLNNGTMTFSLDRGSGKKCYMVGARQLVFTWVDRPGHWIWQHHRESRFAEVAQLNHMKGLEIRGAIGMNNLSPNTTYVGYLVLRMDNIRRWFDRRPIFRIYSDGSDEEQISNEILEIPEHLQLAQGRGGGWWGLEMGEFFSGNGDNGNMVFTLYDILIFGSRRGILIEGFEFRPRNGR